jgi:hypothetical protein
MELQKTTMLGNARLFTSQSANVKAYSIQHGN